jgi:hypothetical protein
MRQSGYAVYSPRRVCLRHERRDRDSARNRPSLNEANPLFVSCRCVGKKPRSSTPSTRVKRLQFEAFGHDGSVGTPAIFSARRRIVQGWQGAAGVSSDVSDADVDDWAMTVVAVVIYGGRLVLRYAIEPDTCGIVITTSACA